MHVSNWLLKWTRERFHEECFRFLINQERACPTSSCIKSNCRLAYDGCVPARVKLKPGVHVLHMQTKLVMYKHKTYKQRYILLHNRLTAMKHIKTIITVTHSCQTLPMSCRLAYSLALAIFISFRLSRDILSRHPPSVFKTYHLKFSRT